MNSIKNLRELSFLVYGLGLTGRSVVNFFKKNKIKSFQVWDDKNKTLYLNNRSKNLNKTFEEVNYIILSPGINLKKTKNELIKYKKKIITDLDLIFLTKNFYKSIVVTGTNGKSTTCKIINHMLKKNKFKTLLGGNIGRPLLNCKIEKKSFLVIEASSFQLAYSKFIKPDYALLLNITNDHLDWHGSMKNYVNSKLTIFRRQSKNQFSIINGNLKYLIQKKIYKGKLVVSKYEDYKKFKYMCKNSYLKLEINDENMSYVFTLSKLIGIRKKSFFNSLNNFKGLSHRYEIFYKKKNCIFINDSKATTFEASKFALKNSKNIFWIVGGLPKLKDKILLNPIKKNIVKIYIIGKNINFFKKQIQNKKSYSVSKTLKKSIIHILNDIRTYNLKENTILLSPASASFDQFLNFEKRGNEFKQLCKYYASKYI